MRKSLVIGNWKMNGSFAMANGLLDSIASGIDDKIRCDIGVCVPYVYMGHVANAVKTSVIKLGAQNVSEHQQGAYTGEISADMLAELGCHWVLIGHSERRQLFHESDEQCVQKIITAQALNLNCVYCVGETQQQRESGDTFAVIEKQMNAVLQDDNVKLNDLVIAYEPVWAIGTGLTATPEEAQTVHAFIRKLLKAQMGEQAEKIKILYGGSVKADNAGTLFNQQDIDGGLIGGAALDAKAFLSICYNAK
jgi:triosephosphate isomerase